MNWLSDTWREVTSGGKARTETYNGRKSAPKRAASPAPQRAPRPTTTAPARPSGGGGGSGRVSASRAPVVAPPRVARSSGSRAPDESSGGRSARGGEWGPRPGRTLNRSEAAQQQAQLDRYRVDPKLSGAEAGAQQQQMVGRAAMAQLDPSLQVLPDEPVMERPQRKAETEKAGAAGPKPWSGRDVIAARGGPKIDADVRELSDDEYLALTPRQRAAVQYNTALVSAANADRAEGTGTTQTAAFLSELDLPTQDLDAFLRLDRAIGDSVLRSLEDPTARAQSAESRRLARGNVAAAPQSERLARAQDAGANAADAMALRLANGWTGLRGGQQAPGMTDSTRDQVLRMAWDFMVDASVEQSPEDIAEGLSQLNANMGTDIAPQELWDFARLQLDAADFGALRNADVTVPVTDATIVPLSVADIRARYGI